VKTHDIIRAAVGALTRGTSEGHVSADTWHNLCSCWDTNEGHNCMQTHGIIRAAVGALTRDTSMQTHGIICAAVGILARGTTVCRHMT
jgi:hypothetical protein